MASQTPVAFRWDQFKVGLIVFFSGLLLVLAISLFPSPWMCILGIIFLIFLIRAIVMVKKPYLFLSDHRLTVYRGFFLRPRIYHLQAVDSVYSLKPEAYIELFWENSSPEKKVKIDLRPLGRKDRIRFIFLLESHVNRKRVFQHINEKGGL